jgi:hypothetical protein
MMGAALLAAGALCLYKEAYFATKVLWALAVLFAGAGAAYPSVLASVHKYWMKLAAALGFVNTRVLLALMFYLAFTPVALARRLLGRDPLGLRFEKGKAGSYWVKKPSIDDVRAYFERQS